MAVVVFCLYWVFRCSFRVVDGVAAAVVVVDNKPMDAKN